jgi:hypothetical protein
MPKKKPTNENLNAAYHNLTLIQVKALKQFVRKDLGKSSPSTLRNWLNGTSEPTLSEKRVLAEFFGQKVETLWPTKSR